MQLVKLDELTKEVNSKIMGGLRDFINAGASLKKIRDGNLFHPDYASFSAYCDGEIIWGKTQSYNAIKAYEKCFQLIQEHKELIAAGQTKTVMLLKYMETPEKTEELLRMAATTDWTGFQNNLKELSGGVATDTHDHVFTLVAFKQCSICGFRVKAEPPTELTTIDGDKR